MVPRLVIINSLRPSGSYVPSDLITKSCAFCICGYRKILSVSRDYFLKKHQPVDLLIVKCCILFEVRTKFLNII
jgi:hypothetical protein